MNSAPCRLRSIVGAACTVTLAAMPAAAQDAAAADSLWLTRAATADSLTVLRTLDARVRARPADAAAWHARGLVAATLATRGNARGFPAALTRNQLDATAARSLRTAVKLDSTNAQYWASLAAYYRTGTDTEKRARDTVLARIVTLTRGTHDTARLIDALVARGELRRARSYVLAVYDSTDGSGRPAPPPGLLAPPPRPTRTAEASHLFDHPARGAALGYDRRPRTVWHAAGKDTLKELPQLLASAIAYVERTPTIVPQYITGAVTPRRDAEPFFAEAYTLAPLDTRVFPALSQLYAGLGEWRQLATLGANRVTRAPDDPWGWLALGLAQQRLRMGAPAGRALEHGFALLPAPERARLDRLDRVLSWGDSIRYDSSNAAVRAATAVETWRFGDPLWSVNESKPRQEFLARIVFAELAFAPDGGGRGGADTPNGDLYVRYGPPDRIASQFWVYRSGLMFNTYAPRFAPAPRVRAGLEFAETNDRIKDWQPSRWDNVTSYRVDSMPTQFARFRGDADSVSVYLAARTPFDSQRAAGIAGAAPVAHTWLQSRDTGAELHDSLGVLPGRTLEWRARVPAGRYYYRAEAVMPGAESAGRSAGLVTLAADSATGFTTRGFGVSDLLIASHIGEEAPRGRRWSDMTFTPLIGAAQAGTSVAVLWEHYDLGERDGAAVYVVKLVLERKWQMFLNRVRARITTAWAAMMGSEQTSDRVIFRYERSVPYAPALADHVTLLLTDVPAGFYNLTVEITDRVTGHATARSLRLVVRE